MSKPPPAQNLHPLVQQALARLVAICRGNGIAQKQITVQDARTADITFSAGTYFDLSPTSETKTIPGRQQAGEVISGAGEIERIARGMMDKAQGNRAIEESLRQQITTRKDKGFMLEGAVMPVPSMNRDVCWHEECRTCHHSGRVQCDQCGGHKYTPCQQCRGRTMMPCTLCRGTGTVTGQRGPQPCNKCNGMRQIPCNVCHRTGKIPCNKCRGSGQMTCPSCNGLAYNTHVVKLGMKAATRADYQRGKVPEHMTFLIENNGPELAARGDITLSTNPMNEMGKMGIHYEAGFPFADITFALGKKPLKVEAYGKGRFVRLPAVLDSLLAPALQLLTRAAKGEGNVAESIKEAGRYRAIAYTLVTTIRANAAQTTKKLMGKYPEGLSQGMAVKIGKAADAAVAIITRKPRYMGLMIGLILVASFYAAYYIGPGRAMVVPYIPDARFNIIIDLFLIFIGGSITTLSIQIAAKSALEKALGHLIPPDKKKKFLPRTHNAGLAGYAGGAMIYFAMIELTRHMEAAATPAWYRAIFNLIGIQ